ncbi:hypothetical protein DTO212C5_4227 [Paecilomyces variotii]|nr:hypothetical protein DTO212C5_4227 [Paecilomyces variotii]
MPPVVSPLLMALPRGFRSYSDTASSTDSGFYPASSESDMSPRRSMMSQPAPLYTTSSNGPIIYQQSGKRTFPHPRDSTPRNPQALAWPIGQAGAYDYGHSQSAVTTSNEEYGRYSHASAHDAFGPIGQPPRPVSVFGDWDSRGHISTDSLMRDQDSSRSLEGSDYSVEISKRRSSGKGRPQVKYYNQRRPSNRDEFDGPHQLLDMPSPRTIAAQERELPHLPTNLDISEQDQILCQVNDCLSQCAFDFIAKYQFPIPVEPDKRQVRVPADREWTEWVYLLKRLATKRRIPARVLYNGQIKQLVTVLENSLEMRHAAKHQSRPVKDDRNVLQLISAGTQVAKILKDATAMEYLDRLYIQTEMLIQDRRAHRAKFGTS